MAGVFGDMQRRDPGEFFCDLGNHPDLALAGGGFCRLILQLTGLKISE